MILGTLFDSGFLNYGDRHLYLTHKRDPQLVVRAYPELGEILSVGNALHIARNFWKEDFRPSGGALRRADKERTR